MPLERLRKAHRTALILDLAQMGILQRRVLRALTGSGNHIAAVEVGLIDYHLEMAMLHASKIYQLLKSRGLDKSAEDWLFTMTGGIKSSNPT